jgi:hypothetical protein
MFLTLVGAGIHYRPGVALGFGLFALQSAKNGGKIEIGSPQKCCD